LHDHEPTSALATIPGDNSSVGALDRLVFNGGVAVSILDIGGDVEPDVGVMSPLGPSRHLVRRSDMSEIGGEAEVTQRSTFSTAMPSLLMPVSWSPSGYCR
jgi:hypothetical protein